jgi:endonuclease/exonuclease/phosphatase family metal-dependent hydrolase
MTSGFRQFATICDRSQQRIQPPNSSPSQGLPVQAKHAVAIVVSHVVVVGGVSCQSSQPVVRLDEDHFFHEQRAKRGPYSPADSEHQVALGMTSSLDTPGLPDRLSVLSFNMEHKEKPEQLKIIAQRLKNDLAETPDFILLQEVVFRSVRTRGDSSTAETLGELLGYYTEGTKRSSDSEGVAILSRYPFLYYASKELKAQTNRLLLGFQRVSVMGEFMVPMIGRVRVVNVHFTNWGFEAHVRHKQIQETLQWMVERQREVPADLTILGGDFNCVPGDDEIRLVTQSPMGRQLGFQDFNSDGPTRGAPGRPNTRVDYIFASSPHTKLKLTGHGERRLWLSGLATATGGSRFWPSDHVPILHEYAVTRPMITAWTQRRPSNSQSRTVP